MKSSQFPVVAEFEYIDPLWRVCALAITTIISRVPVAKAPSIVCGVRISVVHFSLLMEYPCSAYNTGYRVVRLFA